MLLKGRTTSASDTTRVNPCQNSSVEVTKLFDLEPEICKHFAPRLPPGHNSTVAPIDLTVGGISKLVKFHVLIEGRQESLQVLLLNS